MSVDDEIIRLLLEIKTEPDPQSVAAKLDVIKGKIYELEGSYEVLENKVEQFKVMEITTSDEVVRRKNEQVIAANTAIVAQQNTNKMLDEELRAQWLLSKGIVTTADAHGEATKANSSFGRGILQTSYAVQDFTSVLSGGGGLSRAFGSVQNNIPVLLTGLGMGAGLAGVVSVISVGLGAVIPLVSQFFGAMDADKAKAAAAEVQKLAAEVERLKNLQTGGEEATKKRVEDVLKDAPAKKVIEGVQSELVARAEARAVQMIEEEFKETGVVTMSVEDLVKVEPGGELSGQWGQKIKEEVNKIIGRLGIDKSARAQVIGMAQKRPGQFPAGFAEDLAGVEPERFEAAERAGQDEVEEAEHFGQRAHDAGVKRRERAKEKRIAGEGAEHLAEQMQELGAEARRDAKREEQEKVGAENKAAQYARQADEKAARDAAKVAKDMERNEAKAAKQADPMAMNRAAQQAQQSEALGMVQQNTQGFSAKEQGMIAKHLVGNFEMGLQMSQTFDEAMAQAIEQTRKDIWAGVHHGLNRGSQQSQSRFE